MTWTNDMLATESNHIGDAVTVRFGKRTEWFTFIFFPSLLHYLPVFSGHLIVLQQRETGGVLQRNVRKYFSLLDAERNHLKKSDGFMLFGVSSNVIWHVLKQHTSRLQQVLRTLRREGWRGWSP